MRIADSRPGSGSEEGGGDVNGDNGEVRDVTNQPLPASVLATLSSRGSFFLPKCSTVR